VIKDSIQQLKEYVSRKFEIFCTELLSSRYSNIGRWWHKEQEIDIVGLNQDKKKILFAECKWKDNVDALKVISELKEKAKLVDWNKKNRKEEYIVFAKSFLKKDKNCYDLKDIGKMNE
jgi:hypothetical protein